MSPKRNSHREKVIAQKRVVCQDWIKDWENHHQIPNQENESTVDLTGKSITELQSLLQEGSTTVTAILHAFQAKSIHLYENGNSGIAEFIHEADEQAQQLCQSMLETGVRTPIYGIPVSMKECNGVAGYDTSFGLIKYCEKPAKDDCVLVKALRAGGAIPFVLTATSQGAMTPRGFNPVYGRMLNPCSAQHEPGGSSSGEGLLLAQNGSPLGFGSDVGESIRIPASFCGLVGLKPTFNRLSTVGMGEMERAMFLGLEVCIGPMARRVDDLVKAMDALLQPTMFNLDPTVPRLPFDHQLYEGHTKLKLKIGYYSCLEGECLMKSVPAVQSAVERAVQALTANGHELVRYDPPDVFRAFKLGLSCIAPNSGKAIARALRNEPLCESLKKLLQLVTMPDWLKRMGDRKVEKKFGKPATLGHAISKLATSKSVLDALADLKDYRKQFADSWVQAGQLDAVICPTWPTPADSATAAPEATFPAIIYTMLYNIVEYPAGTVPFGNITSDDIQRCQEEASTAKERGDLHHQLTCESQENSVGLPIGVQVVGKPYCEELVLRIMGELESAATSAQD